ncbi:hypothetical protein CEE45_04005 [Candidatus Heimdallarchaeota archaeon B3_Heim]|nr:MAG: hypothetical protein CEE45_04005 [Candidatus Heimdallarchaeota archaeon B3_Heim]
MGNNSIIFLATYAYLAIPQYLSITPNLTNYTKILFNTRDLLSTKYDSKFITQDIKKNYFDDFFELKDFSFNVKGPWKKYQAFRRWKRAIILYMNQIFPQVVVSCSDQSMTDKIISSWCKKNKKAFIVLQPSFISGMHYKKYGISHKIRYLIFNKLLNLPRYRKQHLFGNEEHWTHLLLWSQYFIEDPKRPNMYFVGNPAFDVLFSQFTSKRTLKNNVLICTQNIKAMVGKEAFDQVIDMYIQAINAKPDLTFYIKVHPRESIEKYELLFPKDHFPNAKVVQEDNLYDLFRISDVQISVSSYTSFEAVATGLPIIIVNPNNMFDFIDHFRQEIEIKVTDLEKIAKAIDLARSEHYWMEFVKKREKYFDYMVHSTDGKSGKRAAEKMEEIINFSG